MLLAFGFALNWIAAFVGLTASSVESAQAAATVWLAPLGFISSVYVPPETMPPVLRFIAERNPVTLIVDTVRAVFDGTWPDTTGWSALAWIVVLIAVFLPLSIRRFTRSSA